MNILVTGSNGQLGNEIRKIAGQFKDYQFFFTDVAELDITDPDAIEAFVLENQVKCIINAAAYTAVDKAEEQPEIANLINGEAVGNLAIAAKTAGALLVHVSTDYVFDGAAHQPIHETANPNPQSAYAVSKFLGEQELLENTDKGVIIRTSWLYSEFGNNFVKSMIKYGRERDVLNVVYDQVGTPTYAADLAALILGLIPEWIKLEKSEIFHFSNDGVASWYDFTVAIHEFANVNCRVNAIETKDYPLPAKRPYYSLMAKDKIKKTYDLHLPHWRESLKKCVDIILKNE
ncbi:MAG: dTDP-4-dehydrorhamnose reductase [Bacteroidales bacterium]|nr:dTDP-4-dehydrorhamnose reductase [Bacteroidales bacterium]